jgi:DNA-binding LacI/PurR family transcriptional regulator
LISHGHQKIAALSGPGDWVSCRARVEGYRLAMAEAGLEPEIVTTSSTTHETGYAAMQTALERYPGLTAVFTINDVMATGAIRAAADLGRKVPTDLAVIGFDDIDLAAIYSPPLTTLRVPKRELGILAARRLIDLLTCCDSYTVTSLIGAELIIRQSCGCSPVTQI